MISVVVPWRSNGCPYREAAWAMTSHHNWPPWIEPHTADDGGTPFSRAASINQAVAEHPADTYVIVDADILIAWPQVETAVELANYSNGLVVAFDRWAHLTEQGTQQIIDGYLGSWEPFVDVEWPSLSACVVVSRETWELSGGFDAQFRGWGCEDLAFEAACNALAGPTRKIPGTAWHLYHPSEPNRPVENGPLMGGYLALRDDPNGMRALVASVHAHA